MRNEFDFPLAVLSLSNWGGLAIYGINDYEVVVRFEYGDDFVDRFHTVRLYTNRDGMTFFRLSNKRYYIHDFMEV